MPILIILAIIAGIGLFAVMYGVGVYNKLVALKNRFENSFSQIEVQLKRRYDLIPNIVETVKGYMAHEKGTLEAVINARNQAVGGLKQAAANPGNPAAMHALASAEAGLSGALGRLFALSEAYPDLKANQNMAQLTEEITSTENKVAFARQAYNDSATAYNIYRQSFPPVLFAGILGHGQNAELLDFDDAQIAEAPKVSFT
jgi:LemA protein